MGKKGEVRMTTIDFISIRSQQNFEHDAEINPIEIKIENDTNQNMFEKYKKISVKCYQVLLKMKQKKYL